MEALSASVGAMESPSPFDAEPFVFLDLDVFAGVQREQAAARVIAWISSRNVPVRRIDSQTALRWGLVDELID
jgi:hypothetical protein